MSFCLMIFKRGRGAGTLTPDAEAVVQKGSWLFLISDAYKHALLVNFRFFSNPMTLLEGSFINPLFKDLSDNAAAIMKCRQNRNNC